MRTMTIEHLLMKEDDATLLNIYEELDSGIVPATSYAHDFVRKVNRLINEGKLCVVPGQYRTVYLPTISKMVYKELARRYTMYLCCTKGPESYVQMSIQEPWTGPTVKATPLEPNDGDPCVCDMCNGEFDEADLIPTDLGKLCKDCIKKIREQDGAVSVVR